jgi:hypothetical protein
MADRALRISFRNRDGDISVRSATLVNKRAPASACTEVTHLGTGFWLELRDGDRVVYRRLVSEQFRKDAEVFGGGPGEPFTRVALTLPSEVELAVPLPPTGDPRRLHLVLTERPARDKGRRPGVSSGARGGKRTRTASHVEKQHVDMALSELVDMRQGEK